MVSTTPHLGLPAPSALLLQLLLPTLRPLVRPGEEGLAPLVALEVGPGPGVGLRGRPHEPLSDLPMDQGCQIFLLQHTKTGN
jgi:hypothetical protein